ncbi:MAG TPA: hypothetical protein VGE10_15190, partial [Zeimonas sp.]
QAQRELTLTRIVAPIGGRVDQVGVRVGDRVAAAPDGQVLVTIVATGPVYAAAETPGRYQDRHAGGALRDERSVRAAAS